MADWEGYHSLCEKMKIDHSPTDEIDTGNHKIMKALDKRIEELEKRVYKLDHTNSEYHDRYPGRKNG